MGPIIMGKRKNQSCACEKFETTTIDNIHIIYWTSVLISFLNNFLSKYYLITSTPDSL